MICTFLAGIIDDQTYEHLEENKLLPEEKKEAEENAKERQMHIAKLQEKENKFKYGLGGLQEDL